MHGLRMLHALVLFVFRKSWAWLLLSAVHCFFVVLDKDIVHSSVLAYWIGLVEQGHGGRKPEQYWKQKFWLCYNGDRIPEWKRPSGERRCCESSRTARHRTRGRCKLGLSIPMSSPGQTKLKYSSGLQDRIVSLILSGFFKQELWVEFGSYGWK